MSLDDFYYITQSIINGEIRYGLHFFNQSIGICIVKIKSDIHAYIGLIKLDKKYRGHNLSKTFYDLIESDLQEQGITTITLYAAEFVDKTGKLVSLYQKWGFIVENKKVDTRYENNKLIHDVPMIKNL